MPWEADGVPDDVVASAKGVFAGRAGGRLAQLVEDDLVDGSGTPSDHGLRFVAEELVVDLRVSLGEERAEIHGRVSPGREAPVEMEFSGVPERRVANVESGSFEFHDVPSGRARLVLRSSAADRPEPTYTDWFRV